MILNIRLHVRAKPQPLDCMIVTLIVMTQQPLWLIPQISFWQGFLQSLLLTGKARDLRKGRKETQWINRRMHECTRWSPTATSSLDRQEEHGWMKQRWSSQHTGTIRHTTSQWPRELVMFSWLQVPQQKQKWKSDWFLLEICGECRVNEISQDDQEGRACSEDKWLRGQTFASATGANESLEVHWWHLSKWVLCRHSSHRQTCSFPPKEQQRKLIGQQWIRMGCQGKLYPLAVSFQICKGWWQWRKGGALFNRGSSVSKLSSWPETSTEDIE